MERGKLVFAISAIVSLIAATGAAAEKIAIAATRTTGSAAVFIAQEKGFFAKEGLDVEFVFFDAAQPVAVAVASGDADVGITGLSAAVYNMGGRQALRIVGGASREKPGFTNSAIIVSNEAYQNGLRSPKDFAGKTIGLTQVGSPYHYVTIRLADKYQIPISSMKLVPLQSFSNIASAAAGGRVDAGLLLSYVALPAEKRGALKIIGWAGDETPWQTAAVLTSANTAAKRRDLIERFMRAYVQGTSAYADVFHPADGRAPTEAVKAEFLAILGKYTRLSTEQVLQGLNYIDPLGRLDVDDVRRQIATWKALGMTEPSVEADAMIDLSFISSAAMPR